ncbi:hypothetical protein NCC49_000921 [Naganishia albida]|nr:hypothetical protein NCC49_000921 [Naganishia albida]
MDRAEAAADTEPHALNLKVMRLSRPGLALNSTPFVQPSSASSSDVGTIFRKSLAEKDAKNSTLLANLFPVAQAENSSLLLQDIPLTPVLLLPEAVGSISLGEAFKSMVTLSNDSPVPVGEPRIIVEIQTNTRKVEVARKEPEPKVDGGKSVLYSNQHLATVVDWEMQELGMTVLSVTVSYDSAIGRREFVRYYKFNVTAPLAIKTKTHLPSSVNALFRPDMRERVYLEVVIQNITHTPISFSSVEFLPVPGIAVVEAPASKHQPKGDTQKSVLLTLFDGAAELLQPGNTRQLLYVLAPTPRPAFPKSSLFLPHYNPGQMLPLGKLDLTWSGPYGETGHLMTSVLGRRAPSVSPTAVLRLPRPAASAGDRPELEVDVTILGWDREEIKEWQCVGMNLRLALRSTVPLKDDERTIHIGCQWLVVKKVKPRPPQEEPVIHTTPLELTPSRGLLSQAQRLPHLLPIRLSRPATPQSPAPASNTSQAPSMSRQASNISTTSTKPQVPPSEPELFPPAPYLDVIDDGCQPEPYDGFIDFTDHSLQLTKVELQDLERAPVVRDETPRTSIDGVQVLPPPPPAKSKTYQEGYVDFQLLCMPERAGLGHIQGLRILQAYDPENLEEGGGRVLAEFPKLGEVWIKPSDEFVRQLVIGSAENAPEDEVLL